MDHTIYYPIFILGNGNFTADNGVMRGSGTLEDPYIIEGWEIDASSATGICITNTTAYFVIQDVMIYDGGWDYPGVLLENVRNGVIDNIKAWNNRHGIFLEKSMSIRIVGNELTANRRAGITLWNSFNNTIVENNATNNYHGIWINYSDKNVVLGNHVSNNSNSGILLHHSDRNEVPENKAWDNSFGIVLGSSSEVILEDNEAMDNDMEGISVTYGSDNIIVNNRVDGNGFGIFLRDSIKNTLNDNRMRSNVHGFGVVGVDLSHYLNSIDTTNTVDGKPIYYWISYRDQKVPSNAGFIGIINSTGILVKDLRMKNNAQGVLFAYTNSSRIEDVEASWNSDGLYVWASYNNVFTSNTLTHNGHTVIEFGYGIFIESSNENLIYDNYFHNKENAHDDGNNSWNTTKTCTSEGKCRGGNHWTDYPGTDKDGDGIGDTPYEILGGENRDHLPLKSPMKGSATNFNLILITSVLVVSFSLIAIIIIQRSWRKITDIEDSISKHQNS